MIYLKTEVTNIIQSCSIRTTLQEQESNTMIASSSTTH